MHLYLLFSSSVVSDIPGDAMSKFRVHIPSLILGAIATALLNALLAFFIYAIEALFILNP